MRKLAAVPVFFGVLLVSEVSAQHLAPDGLTIPPSVQEEHETLLGELDFALNAGGKTGKAAADLKRVLMPHFRREEEVALPPLGALRPCVNRQLTGEMAARVATLSATLKKELPSMLKEHQAIRQAVQSLREAAVAERQTRVADFTKALAHHARTEEEVLYPAAVLAAKCAE